MPLPNDATVKRKLRAQIERSIKELQDGEPITYSFYFEENCIRLDRGGIMSMKIYNNSVDMYFMGKSISLKRAQSEAEDFQMMCGSELYFDHELEKRTELLVDLHIEYVLKSCSVRRYKEGENVNQPNS